MPYDLDTHILTVDANVIGKIDTNNPSTLFSIWTVFSRCASSVEKGRRLENLSWRLWNKESNRSFSPCSTPATETASTARHTSSSSASAHVTDFPTPLYRTASTVSHPHEIPLLSGSVDSIPDEEALEFLDSLENYRPCMRRFDSTATDHSTSTHRGDDFEKMVVSIISDKEPLKSPLSLHLPPSSRTSSSSTSTDKSRLLQKSKSMAPISSSRQLVQAPKLASSQYETHSQSQMWTDPTPPTSHQPTFSPAKRQQSSQIQGEVITASSGKMQSSLECVANKEHVTKGGRSLSNGSRNPSVRFLQALSPATRSVAIATPSTVVAKTSGSSGSLSASLTNTPLMTKAIPKSRHQDAHSPDASSHPLTSALTTSLTRKLRALELEAAEKKKAPTPKVEEEPITTIVDSTVVVRGFRPSPIASFSQDNLRDLSSSHVEQSYHQTGSSGVAAPIPTPSAASSHHASQARPPSVFAGSSGTASLEEEDETGSDDEAAGPSQVKKSNAMFTFGGSVSSSDVSRSPESSKAATSLLNARNRIFQMGPSSDETGLGNVPSHLSPTAPYLSDRRAPAQRRLSRLRDTETSSSLSDQVVSQSMTDVDESAIDDDDDDESEWEDSTEESNRNSVEDKGYFKRVDSTAYLPSRRSMITMMFERNASNNILAHNNNLNQGLGGARRFMGPQASQSTSALHGNRPVRNGPSMVPSGDNLHVNENQQPLHQHQHQHQHQQPHPHMFRQGPHGPGAMPMAMHGHVPSNLGGAQPIAMTPRTTRRNMLATELPGSLRRHILWERQQRFSTANAALKRRHTSTDVANLSQYPRVDDQEHWTQVLDKDAMSDYHAKGW